MNLVRPAKRYALDRHGTQCRPNASNEPIGIHLAEVSGYVVEATTLESNKSHGEIAFKIAIAG